MENLTTTEVQCVAELTARILDTSVEILEKYGLFNNDMFVLSNEVDNYVTNLINQIRECK